MLLTAGPSGVAVGLWDCPGLSPPLCKGLASAHHSRRITGSESAASATSVRQKRTPTSPLGSTPLANLTWNPAGRCPANAGPRVPAAGIWKDTWNLARQ